MARINIDDQLRADPRFNCLVEKIGKVQAFGSLICLWDFGMVHWKNHKRLMPKAAIKCLANHQALMDCGFMEEREEGFYCSGAEEHWHFLLVPSENGKLGGRISAQRSRDAKGRLISKQAPSAIQAKSSKTNPSTSTSTSNKNPPTPLVEKSTQLNKWDMLRDEMFAYGRTSLGYSDSFIEERWQEMMDYYEPREVKNHKLTARNWLNGRISKEKWQHCKPGKTAREILLEAGCEL